MFGFSQNIYFEVLYFDGFCFVFFCPNFEEVGRKDVDCHVYGTTITIFQNKIEVSRHLLKAILFLMRILNCMFNLSYSLFQEASCLETAAPPCSHPLPPIHTMCIYEPNTFWPFGHVKEIPGSLTAEFQFSSSNCNHLVCTSVHVNITGILQNK